MADKPFVTISEAHTIFGTTWGGAIIIFRQNMNCRE